MSGDLDLRVRIAAFEWLRAQIDRRGDDVLPREVLATGFDFEGRRVPLLGPQGIFKPALCEVPLSITTIPGAYDDSIDAHNLVRYRYRGTDLDHPDNVGLRRAMREHRPLVYFYRVVPARYLVTLPAYIVGDRRGELAFDVAVDDFAHLSFGSQSAAREDASEARRSYITALVRQRLHQRSFRERVVRAYRMSCAFCRLRHEELLDAAHIIPDTDPEGQPVVANGLALCKLHHAAFDRNFIGVRPDYVIEVSRSILLEEDGPMLRHGLQGLHQRPILLPSLAFDRPDPVRLERRYEEFRLAEAG